jgi:hypothetical protein
MLASSTAKLGFAVDRGSAALGSGVAHALADLLGKLLVKARREQVVGKSFSTRRWIELIPVEDFHLRHLHDVVMSP